MSARAIKNIKVIAAMVVIVGLIILGSVLNPSESSANDQEVPAAALPVTASIH